MSQKEFKIFLKTKAEAILNISINRVLDEVANKVISEGVRKER